MKRDTQVGQEATGSGKQKESQTMRGGRRRGKACMLSQALGAGENAGGRSV